MEEPLFTAKHALMFSVAVYKSHIEYHELFNKRVIPISKIADVDLMPLLSSGVTLILTSGEKVLIALHRNDFKKFAEIVTNLMDENNRGNNLQDKQPSYLDELEKLAELKNKKLITAEEYETKKKQLLNI